MIDGQGGLFEIVDAELGALELLPHQRPTVYPLYDGTPPHEAPSTSLEAAIRILPVAGTLRARVLAHITAEGAVGATDDEIEIALDLRHQTASARRRELALLGLIRSTGERPTRSGRKAKVWVAA